ncbi:MAG TPA: sigma 54-interacting transcriptional regulator [Polyangiaceae bacterium]|jgi:DNA-binding NtrC family response regulator|nr:sigma 54-interacting transcriptional regulator [Polyangiaceae bacterium]
MMAPHSTDTRVASESLARLVLLVYHRDGGQLVPLKPGVAVVVGREPPADIIVNDRSLSRRHARFAWTDEGLIVSDLGSTNGTLLRGSAVRDSRLSPGDEVSLGDIKVTVQQLGGGAHGPHGLSSHDHFQPLVEAEIARAGFFARPFALAMVRALDHSVPLRFWVPQIHALWRPCDAAAAYSDHVLEVLLPEVSGAELESALSAIVQESTTALSVGVAMYPVAANSVEELVASACRALAFASADEPIVFAPGERTHHGALADEQQTCVAASATMRTLLETSARVSRGAIPVLVIGETGTGKEVLARYIHDHSPRKEKPIVCVNCAGIPGALLESTLFGHERGAFTGATSQQAGVFEAAHGGTVFLDEIGELTAAAQAALLRVLEIKRFARVGSTREISVDVRIVAATHRDLEAMVLEGRFREDLLYRLNTITLKVPPLRQRPEDIPVLAHCFLEEANRTNETRVRSIDARVLTLLETYSWPGNVRELRNVIERAVVIARRDTIGVDDLPERVRGPLSIRSEPPPSSGKDDVAGIVDLRALTGDFRVRMEHLEAALLREALDDARWNKAETARRLGMPLRTLVHKVKLHGLRRPLR